ncbi:MAG: helix-turn-helix domain-containing protein [Christensenellaceae bacterium]
MFKLDRLFLTMDKKSVSTYRLREECGIDSKTVRRLRANQNVEMKTHNRICSFLDCKIEDVVEFIKD